MNFTTFIRHLAALKEAGWGTALIDTPCSQFPNDHMHLCLRLQRPSNDMNDWLSPIEAVAEVFDSGRNAELPYSDNRISLHAIVMASEYVDWLEYGYYKYAEVRMEMLHTLGVSREEVIARSPQPRGAGAQFRLQLQ